MASVQKKSSVSDTVTVTPDGTIIVDAKMLLEKQHIREMMREIRSKVITIRRRRLPRTLIRTVDVP